MTILKKIREIVLDTETTGLECESGDRIVEIGCIELIDHVPTGKEYHVYVNPEREMDKESIEITGITNEFLMDKPLFSEIVDEFLEFVGDGTLVIHNAKFDIDFLNCELSRLGKPQFKLEEAIDTLFIAHQKFPGAPASLDALCRRFSIDTSIRTKHGALIDCVLLAEVYIQLLGGKQSGLNFFEKENFESVTVVYNQGNRKKRVFHPSEEELALHKEFVASLGENALWNKIVEAKA